jgi:hypothetical protein
MLMIPPAPPRPSMTKAKVTASIIGSSHGSLRTQPSAPCPPRSLPAISTEARMVNTVSSVGTVTMAVITACTNLKPGADLRVGEQVVDADRHREDEEEHERDAAHGVAVQAPPMARGTIE